MVNFIYCLSFLLTVGLVSDSAFAVTFGKGRENRYDNEYYETTNSDFQLECIKWHNYYRQLHGSPPLQYSSTLADFARYRATELAKKDGTNFYHPDNLQYGENLAWNSRVPMDCQTPLKLWYDEWKIYNFQRPNISPKTGHFTQMVWKDTTQIGCGQVVSKGKNGGTFTVCSYNPPGNYQNEELDNVRPATGQAVTNSYSSNRQYKKKTQQTYYNKQTSNYNNGQQYYYNSNPTASAQSYGTQSFASKWGSFRPHSNTYYSRSYSNNNVAPTYNTGYLNSASPVTSTSTNINTNTNTGYNGANWYRKYYQPNTYTYQW